jgi:hypothetical protein
VVVFPVRDGPLTDSYLSDLAIERSVALAELEQATKHNLNGLVATRYDALACMGWNPNSYYTLDATERAAIKVPRHIRKHPCRRLGDWELRAWRDAYRADLLRWASNH